MCQNLNKYSIMKKKMMFILVVVIVVSCSKEEAEIRNTTPVENTNPSNFPPTETLFFEAIANNGNGFKVWGDGDFELEGLSGFQNCRKDDFMTLRTDSTYSYNNGAIICGADSQNKTGVWEIDFATKTITFDKGTASEYNATIIFLSSSKFILEGTWLGLRIKGDYKS
jgi:hypothetical protein